MITEEKDAGSWRMSLISDSSQICSIKAQRNTVTDWKQAQIKHVGELSLSVYKVDYPFTPLLVLLSSYPTINIPIFKGSQRKQEGFV